MAHIRQSRPDYGLDFQVIRGTTRAEDDQGTPTQSHISPSILVYEDKTFQVVHYPLGSGWAEPGRDTDRYSSQFKNKNFAEMCSGSEAGSYLRLIDFFINQLFFFITFRPIVE